MADSLFRVLWGLKAKEALKQMSRRLTDAAKRHELIEAVKSLDEKLRNAPLLVGEIYRERGGVEEHIAVDRFLAVDFAVDKDHRLVLVRSCSSLSGHGL